MKPILALLCLLLLPIIASGDDGHTWYQSPHQFFWPRQLDVAVPDGWDEAKKAAVRFGLMSVLKHQEEINHTRPGQRARVGDVLSVREVPVTVRFVRRTARTPMVIEIVKQPIGQRGRFCHGRFRQSVIEIDPDDARRPQDILDVVIHEAGHGAGGHHQ